MKAVIKAMLKQLIDFSIALMGNSTIGRYIYRQVTVNAMERVQEVRHRGITLSFAVPNALNQFRSDTFSTKEPETLEWIENISKNSVLWDIGANVGLYSCYAAKARNCRIFAFEPSVFNLELLARNIFANNLSSLITIVPLPLSSELTISKLNMTSTEWGGALSTFDQSFGYDGQPLDKIFEFSRFEQVW